MALNSSGPISLAGTAAGQSIQVELGGNGTTQISLNCTNVRTLAGVPTGAIVMPTNFWGKSNSIPFGCATYTTAGTYSFVVPTGATKICVVCVGGGGGGIALDCVCILQPSGGGGALSYTNCISTTPGETLTVVVGAGSPPGEGSYNRNPGGNSSVARGGTTLVLAQGGRGATVGSFLAPGGQASSGVGAVRYSGGNGRYAGGGASGFSGDGGPGSATLKTPGSAGSGGGGGGGGSGTLDRNGGGGGVGIVVLGANGAAGGVSGVCGLGGGGGSGGTAGLAGNALATGGAYGGGGGSHGDLNSAPSAGGGGVGGVRIIYGGVGKTYPSNSAP